MEGLIYVHDSQPGYRRRRHGRGFVYLDQRGNITRDKEPVERIKKLKIPPAWQQVWICHKPNGYLQATGKDGRYRKQYIYHPQWMAFSQQEKFDALRNFGRVLPQLRETTAAHLRKRGWPLEKVLALVVTFMDKKFLRVGNLSYRNSNDTYGITTLRRKHLKEQEGKLMLEYKAKSGKMRRISIENRQLIRLVKESSELPGYELFKYIDDDGSRRTIDSSDVNEYLRTITGETFTSKTFRTWGGTTIALQQWHFAKEEKAENPHKNLKATIVKKVAEELGNTKAVAEKYYIHPAILKIISDEEFAPEHIIMKTFSEIEMKYLDTHEMEVLSLLEEAFKDISN
jgi:DNA topoisomerase-1